MTQSPQTQAAGEQAFLYWYWASGLTNQGISYDEAKAHLLANAPEGYTWMLGDIIMHSGLSDSQVKSVMEGLGAQGYGQYPVRTTDFGQAVVDKQGSFTVEFTTAVKEGVADAGSEIASVAKIGGTAVLIVAAVALILFAYEKGTH